VIFAAKAACWPREISDLQVLLLVDFLSATVVLGFLQGMYLREEPWERLLKDEQFGALLFPVMVLAEDEEHRLTAAPVTAEDRDTALDALANTILLIYRYFRSPAKPQRTVAKKRSAVKKRTRQ
jgi:hypothetical protein